MRVSPCQSETTLERAARMQSKHDCGVPTSMASFLPFVLLALSLLPVACRSGARSTGVPCTCGQPEADFRGCAHQVCLAGRRNPENPDCVCGTLSITK